METNDLHFTSLEQLIIEKIDDNLEFFVSNNLNVLAKNYYVGEATIIRLVRKLGFDSLKKMQLSYSNQLSIENISKINPETEPLTLNDIIQETSALSIYPILETVKNLNQDNLKQIINQLKNSSTLIIFSTGNANYAAQYLYRSLLVIGKQIFKINSIDEFFQVEELSNSKDLMVIIFSNSGLKNEVIKVYEDAVKNNWSTLWIGSTRSLMHQTPLINASYKLSYKVHYVEKNFYPAISAINGQMFIANIISNCLIKTIKDSEKKIDNLNQKINKWYFE